MLECRLMASIINGLLGILGSNFGDDNKIIVI
jgi:hypothetical protein